MAIKFEDLHLYLHKQWDEVASSQEDSHMVTRIHKIQHIGASVHVKMERSKFGCQATVTITPKETEEIMPVVLSFFQNYNIVGSTRCVFDKLIINRRIVHLS